LQSPGIEEYPLSKMLHFLKDDHWRHVRNLITPTFSSGKLRRVTKLSSSLNNSSNLSNMFEYTLEEDLWSRDWWIDRRLCSRIFSIDFLNLRAQDCGELTILVGCQFLQLSICKELNTNTICILTDECCYIDLWAVGGVGFVAMGGGRECQGSVGPPNLLI